MTHEIYLVFLYLSNIFYCDSSGEAGAEALAQGCDMVVQEQPEIDRQSDARCRYKQRCVRQRDGSLVETQTFSLSGHVGPVMKFHFCSIVVAFWNGLRGFFFSGP